MDITIWLSVCKESDFFLKKSLTFPLINIRLVINKINQILKGVTQMVLNIKDFPDELHREAKIKAAVLGIPLRELVIESIKDFLKKHKKEV